MKANQVNKTQRGGVLVWRQLCPAVNTGNVVEEEWQETTSATYDQDENSPTFGDELSPAVWSMVTVRDSPLTVDELARWAAAEARDVERSERAAVKGLLADLTQIVEAGSLTNAQAVAAIKKLARVCRRLVIDAVD